MNLPGVRKDQVDLSTFAKRAVAEPSWLDPWSLIRHYDRVRGGR